MILSGDVEEERCCLKRYYYYVRLQIADCRLQIADCRLLQPVTGTGTFLLRVACFAFSLDADLTFRAFFRTENGANFEDVEEQDPWYVLRVTGTYRLPFDL